MEAASDSGSLLTIDGSDERLLTGDTHSVMLLSTCPQCKTARQGLKDHDITYREMVVDTSAEAKHVADQLGLDAVPVFLIGYKQIT